MAVNTENIPTANVNSFCHLAKNNTKFGFKIQCIAIASNFQDSSSDDELDIECTQNEKELLDFVLDKYRNGVFELFNIIARKLDQIQGQEGYGEKIIKDCSEEFDRLIEERQMKREMGQSKVQVS